MGKSTRPHQVDRDGLLKTQPAGWDKYRPAKPETTMTDKERQKWLRNWEMPNFNLTQEQYEGLFPLPETTYDPYDRDPFWDRELPCDLFRPADYQNATLEECIEGWEVVQRHEAETIQKDIRTEFMRHYKRRARMLGFDIEKNQWIPEEQRQNQKPKNLLHKLKRKLGHPWEAELKFHRWTREEIVASGNEEAYQKGEPLTEFPWRSGKYPRIADVLKKPENKNAIMNS